MDIRIYPVRSKNDLRKFIHLPSKIHKNHTNWVPPIYMDDWQFFDPKKNRLFSHSDTILLLASQNGQVVGRIMGIINHRYNKAKNENNAGFCFFEPYNDYDVAKAFLNAIERWAKEKNTEKSSTDLAKELTDHIPIEKSVAVNVKAIRTQDEMYGTLLNIKS